MLSHAQLPHRFFVFPWWLQSHDAWLTRACGGAVSAAGPSRRSVARLLLSRVGDLHYLGLLAFLEGRAVHLEALLVVAHQRQDGPCLHLAAPRLHVFLAPAR